MCCLTGNKRFDFGADADHLPDLEFLSWHNYEYIVWSAALERVSGLRVFLRNYNFLKVAHNLVGGVA